MIKNAFQTVSLQIFTQVSFPKSPCNEGLLSKHNSEAKCTGHKIKRCLVNIRY